MKRLRVLLAIRDPAVCEMLRRVLENSGATLLGTIDPSTRPHSLKSPMFSADVVLMKADEITLQNRRLSVLTWLPRSVPVLAVVTQENLWAMCELPNRINGLIVGKSNDEEKSLATQVELALEGYCILPNHRRTFVSDWRRILQQRLTQQEWKVLVALGSGSTNREIAASLGCDESRAKTLVRAVLAKLRAQNRTSAGVLVAYLMARQALNHP